MDTRTCTVCDNGDGHHHEAHRPLALEPLTPADWLEVLAIHRRYLADLHRIVERARLRKIMAEGAARGAVVSRNIKAALARRGQGTP